MLQKPHAIKPSLVVKAMQQLKALHIERPELFEKDISAGMMERAYADLPEIRMGKNGLFIVPSASQPDGVYEVKIVKDETGMVTSTCHCKAFERHGICHHRIAARAVFQAAV